MNKNKQQAKKSLDNLLNALENGIINKTTNQRMRELETKIEELESQILIEKSKLNFRITENDIKEYCLQALKKDPMDLVNYLVKEIKLYNDKIEITFNTPLKASPDNQDLPFLIATKYLHRQITTEILCLFYV